MYLNFRLSNIFTERYPNVERRCFQSNCLFHYLYLSNNYYEIDGLETLCKYVKNQQ